MKTNANSNQSLPQEMHQNMQSKGKYYKNTNDLLQSIYQNLSCYVLCYMFPKGDAILKQSVNRTNADSMNTIRHENSRTSNAIQQNNVMSQSMKTGHASMHNPQNISGNMAVNRIQTPNSIVQHQINRIQTPNSITKHRPHTENTAIDAFKSEYF